MKMKEINRKPTSLLLFFFFFFFFFFSNIIIPPLFLQPTNCWVPPPLEVEVGVIVVEMGALEGKMLQTTISMAVSDFYALHSHFTTRLLLHFIRASKGNPLQVLSSAADLLKNSTKLRTIVVLGARSKPESEFLEEFGEKTGIPIISFFSFPDSPQVVVEGLASPIVFKSNVGKTQELSPTALWAQSLIWDLAWATEKEETVGYYFGDHGSLLSQHNFFSVEKMYHQLGHRHRHRHRRSIEEVHDQGSSNSYDDEDDDLSIKKVVDADSSRRLHHDVAQQNGGCGEGPRKLRVGVPVGISTFDELYKVDAHHNHHHHDSSATFSVRGFCVDVFKSAIHRLPYEVSFEFVPFAVQPSGYDVYNYEDLVYQVHLLELDTAVADIQISSNGTNYVDFTIPYTDVGVGLLRKKREEKTPWIFTKPLTGALWATMGGFLIWIGFVVWAIERDVNGDFRGSILQQIATALWFSFSTIFFAHREKLKSNLSRFVVVIWLFVVLIVNASYTATLTSMLTLQEIDKLTLSPFYGNKTTTASSVNHTMRGFEDFFLNGGGGDGGKILEAPVPYIKLFIAKHPKDYSMLGPVFSHANGFGFPFPKGSRLAADMSTAIAEMREEGKLQMMQDAWFNSRVVDDVLVSADVNDEDEDEDDSVKPLTLERFEALFLISGSASVLALLLFCLSRLPVFKSIVKKSGGGGRDTNIS